MSTNIVRLNPEYFPNPTIGRPLANADIYVGKIDLDPEIVANQKQISVQQENGTITPVAQPISTGAGGIPLYNGSPVTILVDGNYSLKVLDSGGSQVYYVPNVANFNTNTVTSIENLAALRAVSNQEANETVEMLGYAAAGDGGGGSFYFDSSDLSTEVAADTQSGIYVAPNSDLTGASGAWVRLYSGDADIKWFGGKEDGTDDGDALQGALNNSRSVRIKDGDCAISPVTVPNDTTLIIDKGVTVTPINVVENDKLIEVTGNNSSIISEGTINGSREAITLIGCSGNNNVFDILEVRNIATTATSVAFLSGMDITGDDNVVKRIYGYDFFNDGNPNESGARVVSIQSTAANNILEFVYGEDCQDVLVQGTAATGTRVKELVGKDVVDNVLYLLGGDMWVGSVYHSSATTSPEVVVLEGDFNCDSIICESTAVGVVSLQDAGVVSINTIQVNAPTNLATGSLINLRSGNTESESLYVGRVHGFFAGDNFSNFNNGVLKNLLIGDIDVRFYAVTGILGVPTSWLRMDGVEYFSIERFNVNIISSIIADVNNYTMVAPDPVKLCRIGDVTVRCTLTDGTIGTHNFRGQGFAHEFIFVKGAVWDNVGPYMRELDLYENGLMNQIGDAPVSGYWKAGTYLTDGNVTVGGGVKALGYYCKVSGTPGTWSDVSVTFSA